MKIETYTYNPFLTNCFLIQSAGEIAVVDPSCQSEAEIQDLLGHIERSEGDVTRLLLTHAHIDHIFGCRALSETFSLPFVLHAEDWPLIEQSAAQAALFGLPLDVTGVELQAVEAGQKIHIGDEVLDVVHVPGHSPGSVAYISHGTREIFGGDVLFSGSIGRTDLWKGSMAELLGSIKREFLSLEDDYAVYPGHGPATTIGRERGTNPFLRQV